MSLLKLLGQMGQGSLYSRWMKRGVNHWEKLSVNYRSKSSFNVGTQTLDASVIHLRNGSRGEGIGMGHRNKPVKSNK